MGGSQYGALILYVVPDSPAGKIGLKRGEWIFEIDDKPLSETNYTTLLGGEATKFGMGVWYGNGFVPIGEYTIEAARKIDDNPIHYYNMYRPANDNSKRIGYLVYNHFTAGINDEDNTYDDDLRKISHEFKDKDVNEFILDLRYNNGGLLTSAELLCAILAPESVLGKSIGYVEFNDKHNPQTQDLSLDANILKGGVNLNLSTLYVLVSESSASASEMVINSLSPYMKVVLIGMQTEGKNVGSTTYKNDEFNWELRPIICKIYNSEDKSDYENGFIPDYTADESLDTNINSFLDFGNPDELLLNTALRLINGTYKEEGEDYAASRSLTGKPVLVHCSLDRKATNGVIIR
ncbi:putative CtpA-like serine protease [termite gut metagenome]|uniref:Putative CtpA-like serine protease n=1 Tax=termite gut metagenome TaxID=433724 RepID=A0A5J4S4M9_9ZZZZ